MNLECFDLTKLSKLTSDLIDEHKCLECCKYYIAPATAACGHTLCHTCWMGRRTCPECATAFNRKGLKPNIPLQNLTHHVQTLVETFEKLFNIKLDEFILGSPCELDSEKDPDKNVKHWLTSSQNHFSAPVQNTEPFSQESQQVIPLKISTSNALIHNDAKKTNNQPKVPKAVHVAPPQDDWDKIELMPNTDDKHISNENVVGPMDIEPFFVEDIEYTVDKPRRSSRKRDLKHNTCENNKPTSKDPSCESEKKSEKTKQTWNNVKRMRKEFSKLNAKNKNKLNVSIEMAKKTQNVKTISNSPVIITEQIVNIDENTPANMDKENDCLPVNFTDKIQELTNLKNNPKIIYDDINRKQINQSTSSCILVSHENVIDLKNARENTHKDMSYESKNVSNSENDKTKEKTDKKMPFIKKSALCPKNISISTTNCNTVDKQTVVDNSEDIEISIKIGSTVTNIVIKKKNDVHIKVNTDREVQTSLGPYHLDQNKVQIKERNVDSINSKGNNNTQSQTNVVTSDKYQNTDMKVNKCTPGKKNTASADTATVQFEITESVEKELSNIMEYETAEGNECALKTINSASKVKQCVTPYHEVGGLGDLNDLDIFNSGSVKEANVQILTAQAPSEVLVSTVHSKFKTQQIVEKRNRDNTEDDITPINKKMKISFQQGVKEKNSISDSEPINYDVVMDKFFANIDVDVGKIQNSDIIDASLNKTDTNKNKHDLSQIIKSTNIPITQITNLQEFNKKNSENIFSPLEKIDENAVTQKRNEKVSQQVDELLTPVVCHNLNSSQGSNGGVYNTSNHKRKTQQYDDSDMSVVEETPQKNLSAPKTKRGSTSNLSQDILCETKKIPTKSSVQSVKSVINLSDTMTEFNRSKTEDTVAETAENAKKKVTLETPITITKFVDHIIHKSTPIARKSLNFDDANEDNDDPEVTLCPTSDLIAKTTQEKEFMSKAFEKTPTTPVAKSPVAGNAVLNVNKKYCLAGSCLTPSEISKIKSLCAQHKWSYVDKYTKDLTHLVVGVDEENKSQRSVKYMCALAASKWIVSFDWISTCLKSRNVVNEEYFEALDAYGEPGPRRSRIATQKLFQGLKFYCMPPFSILDIDTLKDMLLAAGGHVVMDMTEVRVTADSNQPALLLAEPEHTQEDRFIYLAMEKSIVPINYEWVLNCLGKYSLCSIHELLLCPMSLLPRETARWPEILITPDREE